MVDNFAHSLSPFKPQKRRHSAKLSLRPQGERKFMRNPIFFLSKENQIGFRINFLSLREEKIVRNDKNFKGW
jgi:hypothetical protein